MKSFGRMLMGSLLIFALLLLCALLVPWMFAQSVWQLRKPSTKPASKEEPVVNELEKMIRQAGRELMDYQVARIFKVPEEMQQTPCDFFGYTVNGRAILIECKMVTRTSLPINDKSNGLSIHQWNELVDANRAGCLALICWAQKDVCWAPNGICKTITMDMAIELAKGRKSISWSDIDDKYARPMTGDKAHLRLLDHWLPVTLD